MTLNEAIEILDKETKTGYAPLQTEEMLRSAQNTVNTIRLIKYGNVSCETLKSLAYFADYVDKLNYVYEQIETEDEEIPDTWEKTVRAYNMVLKYVKYNLREWLKELE